MAHCTSKKIKQPDQVLERATKANCKALKKNCKFTGIKQYQWKKVSKKVVIKNKWENSAKVQKSIEIKVN